MFNQLIEGNEETTKSKLKEYIINNVYLPNDASISITTNSIDKINGSITFIVNLNKYYDHNGIPQTEPYNDHLVTVIGFLKQNKVNTSLSNTIFNINNFDSYLAQKTLNYIDDSEIKEIIYDNRNTIFSGLESDMVINDIQISVSKNYLSGEATVNIKLKKFIFDGYMQTNNLGKDFGNITISGFNRQLPSLLNNQLLTADQVGSQLNITVESVKENIINDVYSTIYINKNRFNLPNDVNISVSIKSLDKINGLIVLTISVDKWYDENGQLQESNYKNNTIQSFELTVTGYIKQNKQNTIIVNDSSKTIDISNLINGVDFKNKQVSEISDEEVRDLILTNKEQLFKNLPNDILDDDFIIEVNRNNDQLSVYINLKKDNINGYEQTSVDGFEIGKINLSGFTNNNEQWYENIWLWVSIVLGLVLLIFIIVVIIVFLKNKKNKERHNNKLSANTLDKKLIETSSSQLNINEAKSNANKNLQKNIEVKKDIKIKSNIKLKNNTTNKSMLGAKSNLSKSYSSSLNKKIPQRKHNSNTFRSNIASGNFKKRTQIGSKKDN